LIVRRRNILLIYSVNNIRYIVANISTDFIVKISAFKRICGLNRLRIFYRTSIEHLDHLPVDHSHSRLDIGFAINCRIGFH
jgi:hypothetical protein